MTQRILLLLLAMQQEMQDYYEQRSEAWQESERGETHQQRIEAVQEIIDALDAIEA